MWGWFITPVYYLSNLSEGLRFSNHVQVLLVVVVFFYVSKGLLAFLLLYFINSDICCFNSKIF